MNKKKFLTNYINTPSPTGYEVALGGQGVWIDYMKSLDKESSITLDSYGNALYKYPYVNKNIKNRKTIVLDAHVDEIAFIVKDITPKGYIKVDTLGGSDISITPSSRAIIWTFKKTPIKGVFGHPAIHVHKREFKSSLDNTFVDIGVKSKKEVIKLGIEIGNPIVMEGDFQELGAYYCGKALDDKIGGFITSQVVKRLLKNKITLDYDLYIVNSVQEEIGLKGAKIVGSTKEIDLAIAIDVCHCTDSPAYSESNGPTKSGLGPVIMTGPSLHNSISSELSNVARKNNITYQRIASGGSSGTNADSYAYSKGIPTGLVKLALKYMHTTVEMVSKKDVDNLIKLLYKTLKDRTLLQINPIGNDLRSF